ncbi:hypothetical protein PHYSODRAFT_506503 [Phytophthora sojae]|uniref:Kri1-like C-terminal domain-containing protein n=1 Tax=Phytophthora sojae (strain P6497) TaxID=1094619 RepID=G4ZN52_PHYSP|nr:hypothetical protein PHYSODRAFT_506503 [Phytophthora sojae]EGZ15375.1 hypothetical protein PHYSODRAFT_506503 [Phytophthora sojae]|eukprot:XP_009529124.1 hypothetical protein PHYSODRAFT_506503 [Phytophthora sojae]
MGSSRSRKGSKAAAQQHDDNDDLLVTKGSSKAARPTPPSSPEVQLKVNQKFAAAFEERKRKEELSALEKRGLNPDDDDDESDSETEDEDGEELTKELDADISKTLKLIRKKDPAIYDSSIAFFKKPESDSDSDDDSDKKGKKKKGSAPLYYKDLVRQQVIAGDQAQIKKDFLKKKTEGEQKQEDEEYEEFTTKYGSKLKKDDMDPDKFLEHYLSSEGWKDKTAVVPHYEDIVKEDEEDAEELEKAEDFEHTYNFRFEEQGSSIIQTHARHIEDTMRREDDSRKRKRAERKERKALERQKKEEELRRLKNLKQAEIEQKLKKVARLMGEAEGTAGLKPEDLEGDFDPEEYDKRMQAVFDEQYYDEDDDDMEKPTWDEEEDKELFAGLPKMTMEEMQREKQKYLDELYSLDYEDLIGDIKCRFKYRQVENNDFGLTVDEIMAADDKELKQLVSLKRMAPYAETEFAVDRKRLKNFKKSVREAQEENRRRKNKEAAETGEAQNGEAEQPKKKRKRNKKKKAKASDEPEKKKKRRSKKKKGGAEKNAFASTGLPTSRLESYKLVKASKK